MVKSMIEQLKLIQDTGEDGIGVGLFNSLHAG